MENMTFWEKIDFHLYVFASENYLLIAVLVAIILMASWAKDWLKNLKKED